jgi:hypothetical protein
MLFHITMTHSVDNCPMYSPPAQQKKLLTEADKMFETAKQLNIKIHFMVAGVGHVMYALVEADSFTALNIYFGGLSIKQDLQIEPVDHFKDVIVAFKKELTKR